MRRTVLMTFLKEAADAAFALMLLTPHDERRLAGPSPGLAAHCARQNVVFEFGYFVGLLGHERVMMLVAVTTFESQRAAYGRSGHTPPRA